MTVKIKRTKQVMGDLYVEVEYDDLKSVTQTVVIDRREINARLKLVEKALGRAYAELDLKQVIVQLVNEIREGKKPLLTEFDYSTLTNVELEST